MISVARKNKAKRLNSSCCRLRSLTLIFSIVSASILKYFRKGLVHAIAPAFQHNEFNQLHEHISIMRATLMSKTSTARLHYLKACFNLPCLKSWKVILKKLEPICRSISKYPPKSKIHGWRRTFSHHPFMCPEL